MNRLVAVVLMAGSWMLSCATAHAQTTPAKESTNHVISDQDLNLLRKDLRSKRKQLIAANLKLLRIQLGGECYREIEAETVVLRRHTGLLPWNAVVQLPVRTRILQCKLAERLLSHRHRDSPPHIDTGHRSRYAL